MPQHRLKLAVVCLGSLLPQCKLFSANSSVKGSAGRRFFVDAAGLDSSLAAWRSATRMEQQKGQDTGFSADPLLAGPLTAGVVGDAAKLPSLSNFQLRASSPMINTGVDLPHQYGLDVGASDFFGRTLPQGTGYDVGPSEF